jgi:hypothetical protein
LNVGSDASDDLGGLLDIAENEVATVTEKVSNLAGIVIVIGDGSSGLPAYRAQTGLFDHLSGVLLGRNTDLHLTSVGVSLVLVPLV